MAQCKAKTKTGETCKAAPLKNKKYCFTHSPDTRAEQAKARKLGGQNRHVPHFGDPATVKTDMHTLEDASGILSYTLAEILGMDNSIARARVLLALYDSFVRSFEIGEFEKRIQALEAKTK